MGSTALGLYRLVAYGCLTLILLPVQWAAVRCPGAAPRKLSRRLPVFYHGLCCRVLGLDVVVRGRVSQNQPTLFVCNHVSYLDITVLGSLIPGSFVAKTEVGSWPLFGTLARLQRTVFIDRRVRNARHDGDTLRDRLANGDQMILFPEGTSSDGNRLLPFKSALFSVANLRTRPDGPGISVQPVSIAPTHLDGIPLGRDLRSVYAWYGDMDMVPHLWSIAGMGRITVGVAFHEPVTIDQFDSRKALANHCWAQVADGLGDHLSGRIPHDRRQSADLAAPADA